jgi:hypothetical protein
MSPFRTTLAGPVPIRFDAVARPFVLSDEWGEAGCPVCGSPIELHQPDPDQPERLLGRCVECSRWFLVMQSEETCACTWLVELPATEKLRALIEESEAQDS